MAGIREAQDEKHNPAMKKNILTEMRIRLLGSLLACSGNIIYTDALQINRFMKPEISDN